MNEFSDAKLETRYQIKFSVEILEVYTGVSWGTPWLASGHIIRTVPFQILDSSLLEDQASGEMRYTTVNDQCGAVVCPDSRHFFLRHIVDDWNFNFYQVHIFTGQLNQVNRFPRWV